MSPRARVLVADDEDDIRETIADVLSSEGYAVSLAADGLEALRVARRYRPDVILLDLMMPRMDGWQFRAAQLDDELLAKIPVVVVSAMVPRDARDLADELLHKPLRLEDLLDAVHRCTSGRCGKPRAPETKQANACASVSSRPPSTRH
jgi:CheY-like chemotaxis protein